MSIMTCDKCGERWDSDVDEECPQGCNDRTCSLCLGTGIGQHGDPDTSKCYACGGRGYDLPAQEDDGDARYEAWKDQRGSEDGL